MKILLAEDDPIMLETLGTCVRAEGFEVLSARHGGEAFTLWKKHQPDLLCLDIMMPEMDGYEVCRLVRAQDQTTPILFLSAKNEEVDVVVGLELGADDFIRKPFTRGEVMARIRAALRRNRSGTKKAKSFVMAALTVWPEELRAESNGSQHDLSPREVSMLKLLHEQANKPVTRDQFLDHCWGQDYFPDSRTLDQHIATLRKKIEVDAANPKIIETVRGVGYRFRNEGS